MATRNERRRKAKAKAIECAVQRIDGYIAQQRRLEVEAIVKANRGFHPSQADRAWSKVSCPTASWGEGYSARGANRVTLSLDKSRVKK